MDKEVSSAVTPQYMSLKVIQVCYVEQSTLEEGCLFTRSWCLDTTQVYSIQRCLVRLLGSFS